MAMDLLQAGVDRSVIALVARTRTRGNHADLSRGDTRHEGEGAREDITAALAEPGRYQPGDQLLGFLNSL